MKQLLPDKREIMAAKRDVEAFFRDHGIVGRTIVDIKSSELCYFPNLEDLLEAQWMDCGTCTDGCVCLLFAGGDHLEVEVPGEAPIILGFNTANLAEYPLEADGTRYRLRTLFQHCLGRRIVRVELEETGERMLFPAYRDVDMSADDEGIRGIRLHLDDGTYLRFYGSIDFFNLEHLQADGEDVLVPMSDLLDELNEETWTYYRQQAEEIGYTVAVFPRWLSAGQKSM